MYQHQEDMGSPVPWFDVPGEGILWPAQYGNYLAGYGAGYGLGPGGCTAMHAGGSAFAVSEQIGDGEVPSGDTVDGSYWIDQGCRAGALAAERRLNDLLEAIERNREIRFRRRRAASMWGDPHIVPRDGLPYSFQGAGEFIAATAEDFEVVLRQEPWRGSRAVAVTTAAGVRVNADVVSIYLQQSPLPNRIVVNGSRLEVGPGPQTLSLAHSRVSIDAAGELVTVEAAGGAILVAISARPPALSITLELNDDVALRTHGLFGRPDGIVGNEWTTADGETLKQYESEQSGWELLHRRFGESWRVAPRDSLLQGQWPALHDPKFPYVLRDLPVVPTAVAEAACKRSAITGASLLDDCVIDVSSTGDLRFAEQARVIQQLQREDTRPSPATIATRVAPPELPCELDRYEWRLVGGGCPYGHVSIDRSNGSWLYQEHGCDSVHGKVSVRGGDVLAETTGSGWDINYTLHTSRGTCDRIRADAVCLPGSRCAGSRQRLEFVRGSKRSR
ncbi:MAG: hypothetical protein RLZZ450_1193 [Pseudomonadota bacterium]|jgi:hypothetical protein